MLSKTLIVRLLTVVIVVVVLWSMWKRIDAIIDNYQKYYDIALLQKIWSQEVKEFDEKFEMKWNKKSNINPAKKVDEDLEKKWEEYKKKSPIPTENKPVPAVADEYTKGYYGGLWNFFITSGFASLFAALFLAGGGFFIIKWLWNKINEQAVEKFFSKFF